MTARLSIREISRRTGVPESTLRYYRSLFPGQIPTLGSGRHRRHPEHAVPVFRQISDLFADGESRQGILRQLEEPRPDAAESGSAAASRVLRMSEARVSPEVEHPLDVSGLPRTVPAGDFEGFVAALMARDRELMAMHRGLLDLVGRLIATFEAKKPVAEARAEAATHEAATTRAPPPHEAWGGGTTAAEGSVETEPSTKASVGSPDSADAEKQLDRLRQSLEREREMVERLRHSKLEIEQRLARFERDDGGQRR